MKTSITQVRIKKETERATTVARASVLMNDEFVVTAFVRQGRKGLYVAFPTKEGAPAFFFTNMDARQEFANTVLAAYDQFIEMEG